MALEAVAVDPLTERAVGVCHQVQDRAAGDAFVGIATAPEELDLDLTRDGVDGQFLNRGAAVSGDGVTDEHWRRWRVN